ncbi:AraC family transcriptional regulator [Aquimarina sp. I32.4]|uniref:helix-turn-helix domain-containing protein n=1 Tax=Aquimarina sp. I32.4 TaxID=2053903 RepID=UPI000CDE65E5|nr:AraC family transcriptional regulator [Aquimarina sp. I32.4]
MKEICLNFDTVNYVKDNAGIKEFTSSSDCKSIVDECYKEVLLEDFKVCYGTCLSKKRSLPCKVVKMYFVIDGESKKQERNLEDSYLFYCNEHNIFYANSNEIPSLCSERCQILEVSLKPVFFEKYAPDCDLFDGFRKQMQKDISCFVGDCNYPITAEMHAIIEEVINCQRKGHYRKMFLESRVLKLLMLQMKQIQDCMEQVDLSVFVNLKLMNQARDLIEKRLKDPLTLSDLAKQIGTNECSLKKGFKKVFGTTVFGYIQNIKMRKAKDLLLIQKMLVNEVSDYLGYKNPQHFSTAFKKKYGISPSYLKDGKL